MYWGRAVENDSYPTDLSTLLNKALRPAAEISSDGLAAMNDNREHAAVKAGVYTSVQKSPFPQKMLPVYANIYCSHIFFTFISGSLVYILPSESQISLALTFLFLFFHIFSSFFCLLIIFYPRMTLVDPPPPPPGVEANCPIYSIHSCVKAGKQQAAVETNGEQVAAVKANHATSCYGECPLCGDLFPVSDLQVSKNAISTLVWYPGLWIRNYYFRIRIRLWV